MSKKATHTDGCSSVKSFLEVRKEGKKQDQFGRDCDGMSQP
jgi:hypothetical protein